LIQVSKIRLGELFYENILNNPLGIAFRNPMDKFGALFVFAYLISFGILLNYFFNKYELRKVFVSKILAVILIVYLCLMQFPLYSGKIFRKHEGILPSYYFSVPQEYYDFKEILDKNKLLSNVYPLPYLEQYFGTVYRWEKGSYQGSHPGYYLFDKSMIGGGNFASIKAFELLGAGKLDDARRLFEALNVRHLIYHKDFDWDYHEGHLSKLNIDKGDLEKSFSLLIRDSKCSEVGKLVHCEYLRDNFYPYIYLSENEAVVEFKKINPTKYRLRVHGIKEEAPLVFSESFHEGWRVYLSQADHEDVAIKNNNLKNYRVLDGNDKDQVNSEELESFIGKGWVTDLGNGKEKVIVHEEWEDGKRKVDYEEKYFIDFISKKFNGTIQNDNLSDGKIWETWFKNSIIRDSHMIANKYSNGWIVDPRHLCEDSGKCLENSDGTFDVELIIEFWPQRLFYWGSLISLISLGGLVGFFVVNCRREKRNGRIKK
jgi:hypothetical protein